MSATTEHAAMAYTQLAELLKAGMPLPEALRTLASDAQRGRFRSALDRVAAEMESGVPAGEAFRREEAALGGMLASVASATAATGKLPELLSELSRWTLAQDRIRREIREAFSYPLMVLFLTSAVFLTIRLFDIGGSALVRDMDADSMMPIAYVSESIVLILSILGVSFPLLVLFGKIMAACSSAIRRAIEEFCIHMPIWRAVCRPLALTRFCSSVAILMKAGTSYHESVALAGALSGFWPFEQAAQRAAALLEKGESQASAWERVRLFPASLRFMTRCGAERGEIPQSFEELAKLYETEAEGRTRLIAMLVPPVTLLFLGGMAFLMIGSFIYPLVDLMTRLGK